MLVSVLVAGVLLVVLACYLAKINRALLQQPPDALALSPARWTTEEIRDAYEKFKEHAIHIDDAFPPATGNRYVVVGGSGFTGGWIVVHLLQRGEHPSNIRILDLKAPTRADLTTGLAREVAFHQVDITNSVQVSNAFDAPWPNINGGELPPLTVIHTASNIRFYERVAFLIPRSSRVNVDGTRLLLENALRVGATTFIYTSSGSVAIRKAKFWLWPWQDRPNNLVQILSDDRHPKHPMLHGDFFSNYAYTKILAESLVRSFDGKMNSQGMVMRTGCLRPANGVFGPGGDISVAAYLVRRVNPTWVQNSIQSEAYVENVSLAHLQYERALLDTRSESAQVADVGGQAFIITDPNPPVAYGDLYHALTVLTDGETQFPFLPPALMLMFAHCVEAVYLSRALLTSMPIVGSMIDRVIPLMIGGDIINLQPSLFPLTSVHLLFDDSRARRLPSKGGIGYKSPFTTLQGVCKLVYDFKVNGSMPEERQKTGGGIGFGVGILKAQRSAGRTSEKLAMRDEAG
jgi:nucleoside-diphosphate-sugar epimerase